MEDFESIHPEDDENRKNNRYLSQKPSVLSTVVFSLITLALLALSIVSCVFWSPLASGLLFGGTGLSYLITSKIYSSYSGKMAFYKLKKMNKKKLKNPEVSNYVKKEENKEKWKEAEMDVNSKKDKTKENNDKNEKEDKNMDDEDDKETTYEECEDEEQEKIKNNGNSKLNKRKINEKGEKTK